MIEVDAIAKGRYTYRSLGNIRYEVTNRQKGNCYTFHLHEADCSCVYKTTNVYQIPYVHIIYLLIQLHLPFSILKQSVRRNIRNTLLKPSNECWVLL